MKIKHRLRGRLRELVGDIFETPGVAVPGGYSVTVADGKEAYVTGCRAILSYDEVMITIDAGEVCVKISGEKLDISRYTDSEITIRGIISGIAIEEWGKC